MLSFSWHSWRNRDSEAKVEEMTSYNVTRGGKGDGEGVVPLEVDVDEASAADDDAGDDGSALVEGGVDECGIGGGARVEEALSERGETAWPSVVADCCDGVECDCVLRPNTYLCRGVGTSTCFNASTAASHPSNHCR